MRVQCWRILPLMWASTRCPFCSSTRNIALGSGSTTRPSTSMAPSFFAMPDTASLTRWCWCPSCAHAGARRAHSEVYRTGGADAPARAPRVVRPQHDNRAARTPSFTVPRCDEGLQPGPRHSGRTRCPHAQARGGTLQGAQLGEPVPLLAGGGPEGGQPRDAAVLRREDPRALGGDRDGVLEV